MRFSSVLLLVLTLITMAWSQPIRIAAVASTRVSATPATPSAQLRTVSLPVRRSFSIVFVPSTGSGLRAAGQGQASMDLGSVSYQHGTSLPGNTTHRDRDSFSTFSRLGIRVDGTGVAPG